MAQYKIVNLNFKIITQNKDYNNTHGLCMICKKPLTEVTSPTSVVVGKCHHAFHKACIAAINCASCPVDNTFWMVDYTENIVP